MKQLFTLFALAAGMASAAFAAPRAQQPAPVAQGVHVAATRTLPNLAPTRAKASVARGSQTLGTPVTTAEGTPALYSKECSGYSSIMGYVVEYDHPDDVAHVVYGADNTVYFYDILSNGRTDTYAVGHKEGDKITLPLPQTLYSIEYDGAMDGLMLNAIDIAVDMEAGTADASINTSVTELTYTVAADGTMTLDPLPEGCYMGLSYNSDDTWAGYADLAQTLTPFNTPAQTVPQDAPIETWAMTFEMQGYPVPVIRSGNDFYFGGIAPVGEFQAFWIKGTLDGNTITVANNQYLGLAESDFFIYGMLGTPYIDDFGDLNYQFLPANEAITFTYDAARQTITPNNPDVALIINRGQFRASAVAGATAPTFLVQTTFAGTPANPCHLDYSEYYRDEYGFGVFYFTIPQLSTTGTLLNPKYLYYNIYVDGEVYEFLPDESQIEQAMTDIPFFYNNSLDFYIPASFPVQREVGIYPMGATTVGVQSVYRFNNVETRSDIVTITAEEQPAPDGLISTPATPSPVTAVRYTDLFGRPVANPLPGALYLRTATHADGTTSTTKHRAR